ncbi:dehydration-responsive protein RD22-like [Pyrus ussuriensis x Pyrus communis]|uniref:Dehydration-responsive protein RD22-like n=1 Tax=Pyrus ussuriensis x Pyrus communis TaxID=2448454 RepID=A0A5N5GUG9_9ROSA|nr:dehydration-responsive protein RD22-like [Pyrus ussuriensis x Pyrus communis]
MVSRQKVITATRDGWIKRVHTKGSWENRRKVNSDTVFGITFTKDGDLVTCDTDQEGLLKVIENGVTGFTSHVNGSKISQIADDVTEGPDGSLYFSVASTKFGLHDWYLDVLEAKAHGQLLEYDPSSGENSILLDHLGLANGVAVSKDQIICWTLKHGSKLDAALLSHPIRPFGGLGGIEFRGIELARPDLLTFGAIPADIFALVFAILHMCGIGIPYRCGKLHFTSLILNSNLITNSVIEDKSTSVEVGNPGSNKARTFITWQQATENHQLREDPNAAALVFLEKNIPTFLTRRTAESIPFSSTKLLEILKHFSLEPSSVEANTIKETIQDCEAPGFKGKEKYCATSLESMIDFTTSKLGTSVEALISIEEEKKATMFMHKYTIMPRVKKLEGEKAVLCYKQNYTYAVFYCHAIKQTRAYIVPLVGADGVKTKAVAVCHIDTSEWNPKNLDIKALQAIYIYIYILTHTHLHLCIYTRCI